MVVVITSTGGVSKRLFTYDRPVDAGLAEWAASYLNEALVGRGVGARTLRSRLTDPTLPPTERAFLEGLAPAFTELADTAEDSLYVEGTARLLAEHRFQDVSQLNALLDLLERRVTLLGVLSQALDQRDLYVRIGAENEAPALRGPVARRGELRAAAAQPRHGLGDRADARWTTRARSARCAPPRCSSRASSKTSTAPASRHAARPLRGARRRPQRRRDGDQEGVPAARPRAAPGHEQHDPEAETKFKEAAEAYEILSDADRRRQYDAYGHDGLRSGGYAPNFEGFGSVSDLFSAFFGSGGFDSAFGTGRGTRGPAPVQGGDVVVAVGVDLARGRARRAGRGRLRGRRPLRALPRQRRRARHADRHLPALPGLRPAPDRGADRVRPDGAQRAVRPLRRRRPDPRAALLGLRRRRAWCARSARSRSTSRPGSPTASGSG